MKIKIFLIIASAIIISCSTPKGTVKIKDSKPPETEVVTDSIQHEMETFDSGFETWYKLHNNPSQYRSEGYYEGWNRKYVSAWNQNARSPQKNSFFEPIVGWEPNVDYEFKIDHELFYYFQYVENVLKIQIMPGGPKAITN